MGMRKVYKYLEGEKEILRFRESWWVVGVNGAVVPDEGFVLVWRCGKRLEVVEVAYRYREKLKEWGEN